MATRIDKFFQTLEEFFELLAEKVDDLHAAGKSTVNADEIRGAMVLLELYGKENSINDFLNAYDFWKDFYKKDPKSLSLDFKTLLGLNASIEAFLVPMRVHNANPNDEIMDSDTVEDIFSFLRALVLHAVLYEEETRKANQSAESAPKSSAESTAEPPAESTANQSVESTAEPPAESAPKSVREQIPLAEVKQNFNAKY